MASRTQQKILLRIIAGHINFNPRTILLGDDGDSHGRGRPKAGLHLSRGTRGVQYHGNAAQGDIAAVISAIRNGCSGGLPAAWLQGKKGNGSLGYRLRINAHLALQSRTGKGVLRRATARCQAGHCRPKPDCKPRTPQGSRLRRHRVVGRLELVVGNRLAALGGAQRPPRR